MEATIICCSGQPAAATVSTGRNNSLEGVPNKLLETPTQNYQLDEQDPSTATRGAESWAAIQT